MQGVTLHEGDGGSVPAYVWTSCLQGMDIHARIVGLYFTIRIAYLYKGCRALLPVNIIRTWLPLPS